MAGRRVYGGSSMAALLQSEGIPPETIEALLASSSSSNGFHGTGSMVNFEDVCRSTPQRPFYGTLDLEETADEDFDECLHQPEKKRRLTANQVQFLEKSFEVENKLEPERKIQLAKDLGLQPRQVAIWFQNRRARWKTKQLEKDYEALNSSYNALKADYDDLLIGKEKLKAEVASLTDQLVLREERERGNLEVLELNRSPPALQSSSSESESEAKAKKTETTVATFKQEDLSSANSAVLDSDSPPYADVALHVEPADSPNAFEPDQSDLSYAEDDVELSECRFLKLEVDYNTGNFNFPIEDQPFWFWHY